MGLEEIYYAVKHEGMTAMEFLKVMIEYESRIRADTARIINTRNGLQIKAKDLKDENH